MNITNEQYQITPNQIEAANKRAELNSMMRIYDTLFANLRKDHTLIDLKQLQQANQSLNEIFKINLVNSK